MKRTTFLLRLLVVRNVLSANAVLNSWSEGIVALEGRHPVAQPIAHELAERVVGRAEVHVRNAFGHSGSELVGARTPLCTRPTLLLSAMVPAGPARSAGRRRPRHDAPGRSAAD